MMAAVVALFMSMGIVKVQANNTDWFNYRQTAGNDFGPKDWDHVSCDDVSECLGYPDGWELGVGWSLGSNQCKHCPADEPHNCGLHHQSPIDLNRDASTTGHDPEW